MMDKLFLTFPSEHYSRQIADFRREYLEAGSAMDGCGALRRTDDPAEFIRSCMDDTAMETLRPGRVMATLFLCVRKEDDRLLGMIQIRHYFNEYLEKYAGHIGYSIRPAERRKGYATEMLRLALPFCRELGLKKVLISCEPWNIGSEKTILRNGGVYESTVYVPGEDIYLKRHWISL